MAEQPPATIEPSPSYISDDPERDSKQFRNLLRLVVGVPKEAVDRSIAEEAEQKKTRKSKESNTE